MVVNMKHESFVCNTKVDGQSCIIIIIIISETQYSDTILR